MLSRVCGVILAGGLGTRLKSVVSDRPKVLAPVAGRPFLSYLLDQIADAGIKRVILCTGYLAGMIEAEFGKSYRSIGISYSIEESPLGTAGALRNCLGEISSDDALILNGDSYCDADIAGFCRWCFDKGVKAGILLNGINDTRRVNVDDAGRITGFVEKGRGGPGLINAGIYLIDKGLISDIPPARTVSLETDCFPNWSAAGVLFGFAAAVKRFIDIGTPESYQEAQKLFSTGH